MLATLENSSKFSEKTVLFVDFQPKICYNFIEVIPMKLMPLTNDVVFKALFGQHDDILKEFLSDTLDIPLGEITGLQVLNPEIVPKTNDGKLTRLDIKLIAGNRNIDIEMQKASEDDYRERILFYWARMYGQSLSKGEPYRNLNQAISLNILNFNMFECPEYHSSFSVHENTRNELFSDKLALHFFELKKVGGSLNADDRKRLWLQLIKADSDEELRELKKVKVPIIQKSVETVYNLNSDTRVQELARIQEEADEMYVSGIYNAEQRGIQQGIQQGNTARYSAGNGTRKRTGKNRNDCQAETFRNV